MYDLIPRIVLTAILVSSLAVANAEEPPPTPGKPIAEGRHPNGPPPEAYQACAGKSAGSRSEFASPHGDKLQGVCENDGHGKIVLRPDRPPVDAPGKHRGPPPEAYAACTGKAVGAKAQFISPRGETVTGTCESEGEKLVLRPDQPPKEHPVERGQGK